MVVEVINKPDGLYAIDIDGLEVYIGSTPAQGLREFIPKVSVKEKVKYFIKLKESGFTADEIQELMREI